MKSISQENNNDSQEFYAELKTPDKIINELKLENKQLSEKNQKQKTFFIIICILFSLIIIAFLIAYKRKK